MFRITQETREDVMAEFGDFSGPHDYFVEMISRLYGEGGKEGKNHEISHLILDWVRQFKSVNIEQAMSIGIFTLMVYRMIELTLGESMPVVSLDVTHPILEEMEGEIALETYAEEKCRILYQENPEIVNLCISMFEDDPTFLIEGSNKYWETKITLMSGLMIYLMVKSQLEANELRKIF